MSEKKNLDRLFQEKFKDFESEPREAVWKNIEAALKEKDDRRVIPFWWKLTGIAAALFLGFMAWNMATGDAGTPNSVVIGTEKQNPSQQGDSNNNAVVNREKEPAESASDHGKTENDNTINQQTNRQNPAPSPENAVASGTKKQKNTLKNPKTDLAPENENAVAGGTGALSKKALKNRTANASNPETAVADAQKASAKKAKPQGRKNRYLPGVSGQNDEALAVHKNKKGSKGKKAALGTSGQDPEVQAIAQAPKNNKNDQLIKESTARNPFAANPEKIAQKETPPAGKKLDSAAVAPVVPNALEELLQQKNEKETKIAETKLNRWQITTNVAPVYFSSTSNGSPIDAEFESNNKTYDNNLAYGLGVNYAVNKKLSVRAGINKLTLSYNTNDVVFYAGLENQGFANITGHSAAIEIKNENVASDGLLPFETSIQNNTTGAINQKMGYIEVPLELSYKLVDRKFGVSFIGGVSTLFLNENRIRVVSPDLSADLGKANNLNDVHFSTNVGLGFKYSFWKAFQFNFEPTFKYQLNTFSNDSGNFKPYFIGLYSGLSFNF